MDSNSINCVTFNLQDLFISFLIEVTKLFFGGGGATKSNPCKDTVARLKLKPTVLLFTPISFCNTLNTGAKSPPPQKQKCIK